jgi:putative flavoprotein involved in K+ transport
MKSIDTLVIGGSQAGLAMSHCLAERGIEHVVLERGRIGERWRSETWKSLRLQTPNWQSRLPGYHYRGADPHGFMTKDELVSYLESYAASFQPPVEEQTAVLDVRSASTGFQVDTTRGAWTARNVVVATGHSAIPWVPEWGQALPADVCQVTPSAYLEPEQLPRGGVLVVGASATGTQLAEEIHLSGRPVTLAVGRHTRFPRRYRGRDIFAWLDGTGVLDERAEQVRDLRRAIAQPSFQLVGTPQHATLDLGTLERMGVRLVGRALAAEGGQVRLQRDLAASMAHADDKLAGILQRIDRFIERAALTAEVQPIDAPSPLAAPAAPPRLDLEREGIRTVLWATGFRRDYSWLSVPVLDAQGDILHRLGVTPAPGLYVLGMRFQCRRNSNFIDGVGVDAAELADRIASGRSRLAA